MMSPPRPAPITQMDDAAAAQVTNVWKSMFPDAAPLPGIGLPSQNKGVMTLTHTMGGPPMTINGLPSGSPLANSALFSSEVSGGRWLNLYEIMLPDIPGVNGASSSVERYVETLVRNGVSTGGDHYHWKGARMMAMPVFAIHSQSTGLMDPIAFSAIHLAAIRNALNAAMSGR